MASSYSVLEDVLERDPSLLKPELPSELELMWDTESPSFSVISTTMFLVLLFAVFFWWRL